MNNSRTTLAMLTSRDRGKEQLMSQYELDIRNRRRANRINRAIQVTAVDRDYRRRLSVALNVSYSGARLVLTQPCPERFTVELDSNTQIAARCVWKRNLSRSQVVGVQFEYSCERERQQVIRFLQRLAS